MAAVRGLELSLRERKILHAPGLQRRHGSHLRQPHSAAEYERLAQAMEYDSERAMFEAYSKNKYASTGVISVDAQQRLAFH